MISSFLPNMGGMEVGLHNIAIRLSALGFEPIVICPYSCAKGVRAKNWSFPYKIEPMPPKIFSFIEFWPYLGFRIFNLYLLYLNKKYKFSFWHVTMAYPTGCAIVSFAELVNNKIKFLIRCAGEDIQKFPEISYGMRLNPKIDRQITATLKKANNVVAITSDVRHEYELIGVDEEKIIDIPNGVDLKKFAKSIDRNDVRSSFGIGDEEFLILSVGRNHPKKNYITVLKIAENLLVRGKTNFKVLCVGKKCEELQADVSRLGLDKYIILKDAIETFENSENDLNLPADELVNIYKSADLFVFPSITETFGVAIVEAMASGLPVITGDSPGCRDVVGYGEWGLMCKPLDYEDFAENIIRFMNSSELRKKFQIKSQERAKFFDWDLIVSKYVSVYEKE